MGKAIDITGKRFGKLKVLKKSEIRQNKKIMWECICDCGTRKTILGASLRGGKTNSCGCIHTEMIIKKNKKRIVSLKGEKIGMLTVLRKTNNRARGSVKWLCKCDCGNYVEVPSICLRRKNKTESCGCKNKVDLTGKTFGKLVVVKDSGSRTKLGSVLWECKCLCGMNKLIETGSLQSGTSKTCGCSRLGENSNFYNPNMSDEERLKHRYILGNPETQNWRKRVYKKDNYTCKVCGNRSIKGNAVILNAHHLNGWNWCEEERFDVENGVTLCVECHTDFHKKYGYGNNTKEQFEEYLTLLPLNH